MPNINSKNRVHGMYPVHTNITRKIIIFVVITSLVLCFNFEKKINKTKKDCWW